MKDLKHSFTPRVVSLIGLLPMLILLAACTAPSSSPDWAALPAAPIAELPNQYLPTWDNQVGSRLDLRVYIETTCREDACKRFFTDTLPFLTSLQQIHVRIYDYPLTQESESFMVAGIGHCVALTSPDAYLAWLREAGTSNLIEDELEMVRISKLVSGKYDSDCLRAEIKKIKPVFENQNPLNLLQTPAMILNGKLLVGYYTQDQWKSLFESAAQ